MRTIAKYCRFRAIRAGAAVLVVLAASRAIAAPIFVDGSDPHADDKNPGTLAAPFKTIQAAMDKAQAGDTVRVRGGVYHESVKFKRGGNYAHGAIFDPGSLSDIQWLTLEAYQDEHVVLDGAVTIPAEKWERVQGCKNTYSTPFATAPYDDRIVNMVFRDGTLIMPTLKNVRGANSSLIEGTTSNIVPVMPDDTPNDEGWYYDQKRKRLFVNFRGRVPGKDAECRAVKWLEGVDAQSVSYARIRKLEVRNFISSGLVVCRGHEFRVEDNYVHHCGHGIWGSPTSGGAIRRNTFTDLMGVCLSLGGARGTVVEENVIQRSNINPYKIVAWDGSAVICNCSFGLALRNNVISDCADICAVWPDCSAAGIILYGNTIYNMGSGFYIEAGAIGTVLRWNTVFDTGSGICFRDNFANVAFENYIFRNHGGLSIGTCEEDDCPKANAMMYNWVIDNGVGGGFAPDRFQEPAHIFDHNVYKFQDWPDVDLRAKKPAVSKIDKNINVELTTNHWPGTNLKSQFLARWTGVINAEKDGAYRFYVKYHAFNGARLFIDNQRIVCHGETHDPISTTEKEGQVELKAGNHEIMLEFFHGASDNLWKSCILSWEPPGGAKAAVPEKSLCHRETASGGLQAGLKAEFFDIAGAPLPLAMGGSVILRYGDKQYKDLASLRAEVGQEPHGRLVTEFDAAPLGLATFRTHGTKKSWEPAPMFSNPAMDRVDLFAPGEPYFWKKGSFRGAEDYGWRGINAGYGTQTRGDGSGFVRVFWTRCGYWDKGPFDDLTASRASAYRRGIASGAPQQDHLACLQVGAAPTADKKISAEGFGYWSPNLPTTDGAQIDLSLWIRAKKVAAAKEGGGVFVTVEFCDETGQNVSRQSVVGGGDGEKPVGADWATGEYLYRQFKGMVAAPRGARWFKLGFGLRNCSGWAAFSDVDIKTRPGVPDKEVKKALPINAARFTWTPCDLAALLNRPSVRSSST